MDLDRISTQLAHQAEAIRALMEGVPDAQARWRPSPDDWSILEVIHHLVDEEIEDFRRHLDHIATPVGGITACRTQLRYHSYTIRRL